MFVRFAGVIGTNLILSGSNLWLLGIGLVATAVITAIVWLWSRRKRSGESQSP